jgi:hypothetical protein
MASALYFAGRAEEALPWARQVMQERPDWSVAHRSLIAALWLSGRHAEARDAAKKHLEMFPRFSVRHDREISPVRGTSGHERYFEALEQAGLPR